MNYDNEFFCKNCRVMFSKNQESEDLEFVCKRCSRKMSENEKPKEESTIHRLVGALLYVRDSGKIQIHKIMEEDFIMLIEIYRPKRYELRGEMSEWISFAIGKVEFHSYHSPQVREAMEKVKKQKPKK